LGVELGDERDYTVDGAHVNTEGGADGESAALQYDGLHLLHGAGEMGADALGGGDVVGVAAAARTDGLHELVVPVVADAEGGDGHVDASGLVGLFEAALFLFGDAVGEEHEAVDVGTGAAGGGIAVAHLLA